MVCAVHLLGIENRWFVVDGMEKRAQTESSFEFEYREYAFERKMEKVHAVWVNPVYNTQTYVLRESGALFGFGENARGQLGVGFEYGNAKHVYMKYPVRIANSIASVIPQSEESEIHMHTMAIKRIAVCGCGGGILSLNLILRPPNTLLSTVLSRINLLRSWKMLRLAQWASITVLS